MPPHGTPALVDREVDAVNRLEDAFLKEDVGLQVLYL